MTIDQVLEKAQRETVRWGDEKFNEGVNAAIAAVRQGLSELAPPAPEPPRRRRPEPAA